MERCAVIAAALCNGSQFLSQLILYKRSRQTAPKTLFLPPPRPYFRLFRHLQSLISFPTAREETVAFGAQRIAGLYDYKGRFSQESRHCLSLYVSKDVILTGVDFAAVYANTTLTSFTFFARDQSSKRRIYLHTRELDLQSAGENAIPLHLNQSICIRAGEMLTLKAEVAGGQ